MRLHRMVLKPRLCRLRRSLTVTVMTALVLLAFSCSEHSAPTEHFESPETGGVGEINVDVVIYGTQTSGLAAARELALQAPHLQIALISSGDLLETPLAQGLGAEDARDIDRVAGGFYGEWRQAVIDIYAKSDIRPFNTGGRFVYEPEVATEAVWSLIGHEKTPSIQLYSGQLMAAGDQDGARFVELSIGSGGSLRLNTRYFIDASVEGDLARMLGADYRIGRGETIYNDLVGPIPAYPSAENNYETAPQRLSALLTLEVYPNGNAPKVATLCHPDYNPLSYGATSSLAQKYVDAFHTSWSMNIAVLPHGKRELNEGWNDWPDLGLAFQWIFSSESRDETRRMVLEWSVNRVRYLQEHGHPQLGIASIPQGLYIREGPRIVGLDTYTAADLRSGALRHPIALGCYTEYDRHDGIYPTSIATTRYARVPMESLMVAGHPALLVSTAISTDCAAYSSAVRMEHTRANMGGAAGTVIVLSDRLGVDPDQVAYEDVRRELTSRGYRLDDAS